MNTPAVRARVPERVVSERDAAWEKYASTVRMGGTPEQRRWAFEEAMKRERLLTVALQVAEKEQKAYMRRHAQHS